MVPTKKQVPISRTCFRILMFMNLFFPFPYLLEESDLTECSFYNVDLNKALFENICFKESEFMHMNLSGINFSSCDITGIKIEERSLRGIKVNQFQAIELATLLGIEIVE